MAKGLSRAIGISNFSITKTERLLQTAKIVPAVNQVECHPYFQQQKLKEYCDSRGDVTIMSLYIANFAFIVKIPELEFVQYNAIMHIVAIPEYGLV